MRHVIATSRSWNEWLAPTLTQQTGDEFILLTREEDLSLERLEEIQPCFIFLPHWSYLIPAEIYERFECVVFHLTDVPFGRGGSPLQNLIERGIYETKLSALRCQRGLDAGPVYLQRQLSLHGAAEEIFLRASRLMADMICEILSTRPEPVEQQGDIVTFPRRKPKQSDISQLSSLDQLFDHIRMLDADGYPHAFLETPAFRLEFRRAARRDGRITADVTITLRNHD